MQIVYGGSNYEDELQTVNLELSKHQSLTTKMEKVRDNLIKAGDSAITKIEELKKMVETREEERVFYDHYRNKVAKMEKPGGESTSADPSDQEKYTRN